MSSALKSTENCPNRDPLTTSRETKGQTRREIGGGPRPNRPNRQTAEPRPRQVWPELDSPPPPEAHASPDAGKAHVETRRLDCPGENLLLQFDPETVGVRELHTAFANCVPGCQNAGRRRSSHSTYLKPVPLQPRAPTRNCPSAGHSGAARWPRVAGPASRPARASR